MVSIGAIALACATTPIDAHLLSKNVLVESSHVGDQLREMIIERAETLIADVKLAIEEEWEKRQAAKE
jgi:hypothetical protein